MEEELLEQEFLEAMFEDMLDEEEQEEWYYPAAQQGAAYTPIDNKMQALNISENKSTAESSKVSSCISIENEL